MIEADFEVSHVKLILGIPTGGTIAMAFKYDSMEKAEAVNQSSKRQPAVFRLFGGVKRLF